MKKRSLLLTVLCAVVGLMFLTGCGNDPKAVTEKWMKALAKGDKKTADQLVSGKASKEVNDKIIEVLKNARKSAEEDNDDVATVILKVFERPQLEEPDIDDPDATVELTIADREKLINLKNVDGKWKVKPASFWDSVESKWKIKPAPQPEVKKPEAPKAEAPKAAAPQAEAPKAEAPKAEVKK